MLVAVARSFTPSNDSAPLLRPAVDQVAPDIVASTPFPESSFTIGPLPRSKEYVASCPATTAVSAGLVAAVGRCHWLSLARSDPDARVGPRIRTTRPGLNGPSGPIPRSR
jgi:hypothetical protein